MNSEYVDMKRGRMRHTPVTLGTTPFAFLFLCDCAEQQYTSLPSLYHLINLLWLYSYRFRHTALWEKHKHSCGVGTLTISHLQIFIKAALKVFYNFSSYLIKRVVSNWCPNEWIIPLSQYSITIMFIFKLIFSLSTLTNFIKIKQK